MGTTACPNCNAAITTSVGWSLWCASCDWNVDPVETMPESWISRRLRSVLDRATRREHRILVKTAGADPGRHPLNRLVVSFAIVIHAVTVLLVVAAVAALFLPIGVFLRVLVAAFLLLIALGVMPFDTNLRRRRHRDRVSGRTRAEAPEFFALIDLVAASLDAPTPDRVRVDRDVNASIGHREGQTILTIGLPLWEILGNEARIALLGHEIGHSINGDLRNKVLIRRAMRSLDKWMSLLWPSTARERALLHRNRVWAARRGGGALALGDLILPVLFAPLFVLALTVGRAFEVCLSRSSQRAEYRADRMAVRVGGNTAMSETLASLLLGDFIDFKLELDARNGVSTSADALRQAVATVPANERERLRRRAEGRMQRVDASHPPTPMRLAYVEAMPYTLAGVVPGPVLMAAATKELYR